MRERSPGMVYTDHQVFERDIHVFAVDTGGRDR